MPVSGLVVTLSPDPDAASAARVRIAADERFELGPAAEGPDPCPRHPAVLVAEDGVACEDAVRELQRWPGVLYVDVVSVDISDLSPATDPTSLAPTSPDPQRQER